MQHTACTILVLLAALLQIYSCQKCSYDTNIDYFGNDLIAEPVFTNSSDGCCMFCAQNSQCQVWTWVPATRACWIKTNVGSKRFKSFGRASGVRQYMSGMNYNSYGGGYPSGGYGGSGYGGYQQQGYGSGYGSGYGNGYTTSTLVTITTSSVSTTTLANIIPTVAGATTVTATTTTTGATLTTTTQPIILTTPGAVSLAPTTTLTNSVAGRASVCFIENNANYPGNDLTGVGNVASAGACCSLCGQTANCVGWSYFTTFTYCFLKTAVPGSPGQPYPGMVSGRIVNSPTSG